MTPTEIRQPPPIDVPEKEVAQEDRRHWSVTTLIGILEKNALVYWAAKEAAICATHHRDTWQSIEDSSGTEEAQRWIANARFRPPKGERESADLGTAVHEVCEQYALTGERPQVDAELRPYLDRFDEWLQEWQPRYIATEVTVFSERFGYAGTSDAFLELDGIPLIIDYKTSRKSFDGRGDPTGPYAESALQLAAYRYADLAAVWRPRRFEKYRRRYYLLGPGEKEHGVPVPEVKGGAVIHITPEHCNIHPVRCDPVVFEAFLDIVEVARWQFELSHKVVGRPMTRPEPRGGHE